MSRTTTVLWVVGSFLCSGLFAAEPPLPQADPDLTVVVPAGENATLTLFGVAESPGTFTIATDSLVPELIVACEPLHRPYFGPCRAARPSDEKMMSGAPPLDHVRTPYFGKRLSGMPQHHFTSPLTGTQRFEVADENPKPR